MKKINIENTVTIIARKSNGIYKLDYYLKEKRGEERSFIYLLESIQKIVTEYANLGRR